MLSRTATPRPYPTRAGLALAIAMLVLAALPSVVWAAPPNTTITAGPRGTVLTGTRSNTATFRFASSKPNSRFQCKIDSGAWRACASPRTYRGLRWGKHAFRVRAIDAQGVVDASPAYRTWRFAPRPGTMLYSKTSWDGFGGWAGDASWQVVDGMLVNDGTSAEDDPMRDFTWIAAPYSPGSEAIANYAVTAKIRFDAEGDLGNFPCGPPNFGVVARKGDGHRGYQGGTGIPNCGSDGFAQIKAVGYEFWRSDDAIASTGFDPGTDWHTYRLELKGNDLSLYIDDDLRVSGRDNRYLTGGRVGLWSDAAQVSVDEFRVVAR